jgi:hypothetical protein
MSYTCRHHAMSSDCDASCHWKRAWVNTYLRFMHQFKLLSSWELPVFCSSFWSILKRGDRRLLRNDESQKTCSMPTNMDAALVLSHKIYGMFEWHLNQHKCDAIGARYIRRPSFFGAKSPTWDAFEMLRATWTAEDKSDFEWHQKLQTDTIQQSTMFV